ncbi:MAG: hypothetical protein N3F63_05110 [Thermoplasmata archaeon]|nr:hypothetical protein [Thermoplasmata archaeon]
MKTYLTVTFNSEGEIPSKIADILYQIGFRPTHGNYDFVYEWKTSVNLQETIELVNRVQNALRGTNILLKFETI